jgi:hypothetical protein
MKQDDKAGLAAAAPKVGRIGLLTIPRRHVMVPYTFFVHFDMKM